MLLHITTSEEWSRCEGGTYRAPSLGTEGFIHLSTADQVLTPANERYRGRRDLVLLVIDPLRLVAPVVFEDSYGAGTKFPHLYGELNRDAVIDVADFPPNPDGSFSLPAALE